MITQRLRFACIQYTILFPVCQLYFLTFFSLSFIDIRQFR